MDIHEFLKDPVTTNNRLKHLKFTTAYDTTIYSKEDAELAFFALQTMLTPIIQVFDHMLPYGKAKDMIGKSLLDSDYASAYLCFADWAKALENDDFKLLCCFAIFMQQYMKMFPDGQQATTEIVKFMMEFEKTYKEKESVKDSAVEQALKLLKGIKDVSQD